MKNEIRCPNCECADKVNVTACVDPDDDKTARRVVFDLTINENSQAKCHACKFEGALADFGYAGGFQRFTQFLL